MDETLRQAIAEAKEQQPVTVELSWYQGAVQLNDIKQYIRANINSASRSFVAIGYYLKYIRDNELYVEDGYQSIWEFAQAEFGISKSSASRFMAINDRFSKDGNSPILLDRYKDFSSSKLSEMLTMTDEQLEQVSITTTVAEIREIKNADKVVATSQQEPDKKYSACKLGGGNCNLFTNPEACSSKSRCSSNFIADCEHEESSPAHRLVVNVVPDTVNDIPKNMCNETEVVNDVGKQLESDDLVLDFYNDKEGWHKEIISDEPDSIVTVEADIIRTEPETETLTDKPKDQLYLAKEMLQKKTDRPKELD